MCSQSNCRIQQSDYDHHEPLFGSDGQKNPFLIQLGELQFLTGPVPGSTLYKFEQISLEFDDDSHIKISR